MLRWANREKDKVKVKVKAKVKRTSMLSLLAICLLCMVVFIGCDKESGKTADKEISGDSATVLYTSSDKLEPSERKISYLMPNNLKKESIAVDEKNQMVNYDVFSGFENTEVETKVNARVQQVIALVEQKINPATIVPYRGIRQVVTPDSKVTQSIISAYAGLNHNHILSIQAYANASYTKSERTQTEAFVSVIEVANLDLNTGDEIPLKSIFIDTYDYERAINDYILNMIGECDAEDEYPSVPNGPYFNLVKPFDGIDENQKYSLDTYGLNLYFDETDDRFLSNYGPVHIHMPWGYFGNHIAIDSRFMLPNQHLFEDNTIKKELVSWNENDSNVETYIEGKFEGGTYAISVLKKLGVSSEAFDAYVKETEALIQNYTMEDQNKEDANENSVFVMMSTTQIGKYEIFSRMIWLNENGESRTHDTFQTYELSKNSRKKIALEDLFIADFNYLDIVVDEITIEQSRRKFTREDVTSIMDQLEFQIALDGIRFYLPSLNPEIYPENINVLIPYERFGFDHLKVFD